MICPQCGHNDPNANKFCSMCGTSFETNLEANIETRKPRGSRKVFIAGILVAVMIIAGTLGYLMISKPDNRPTVTLSSPGFSETKIVSKGTFIDMVWLEEVEGRLPSPGAGLNFAGWYNDPGFTDPFSRFTPIRSQITLFASWNNLTFTLDNSGTVTDNKKTCVFENTTPGTVTSTSWTVTDAFKTNPVNSSKFTFTGTGDIFTADIAPGLYDVVMTTTVDGQEKRMTKLETVTGTITLGKIDWKDYNGTDRTLGPFTFDVSEYIEFAKLNWRRQFKIPEIASFVTYSTPTVQAIAGAFATMFAADPTLTEQDKANIIASFVNDGMSIGQTGASKSDSTFYKIPGVHTSDVSVEYYKYPIESIYDRILYGGVGDCEDHAILTAAIAKVAGFDVAIIVLTNTSQPEGHAIAGIKNDPSFVTPFEPPADTATLKFKEADGYYSCETFRRGMVPWVGLVEAKYTANGWLWRVFPVSA